MAEKKNDKADRKSPNYTFVMRSEMERFGTLKLGYTMKDIDLLIKNIAPNGWGNVRIKFHAENNRPYAVLIPPMDKSKLPDNESVPEDKAPWEKPMEEAPEDVEKQNLPF